MSFALVLKSYGVYKMNGDTFELLLNVLKILQKNRSKNIQAMMEIVDSYTGDMTPEQQAQILKEILHFVKPSDYQQEVYEKALQEDQFREAMQGDFF